MELGIDHRESINQIKLCINPDLLRPTRVSNFALSFKQYASLDPVNIGKYKYSIEQKLLKNGVYKKYLMRQRGDKKKRQTVWIAQKTKDSRYVWRCDIEVDRQDIKQLLQFILTHRLQQDESQCPSILINCGSHSNRQGKSANETSDYALTDPTIYLQIQNVVQELIKEQKTKLTKKNAKNRIYVHMLSTVVPCIYPQNADHIIDALGNGARSKVQSKRLHPKSSSIKEEDLLFIDYPQLKNEHNPVVNNE